MSGKADIQWSDLLKDSEHMLVLIQNHQKSDQKIWIQFLTKLETQQKRFFRTELGSAFVKTLKLKVGTNEDKSKLQCIQGQKNIPQKTQLNDKAELEKVAQWLMSDICELNDKRKKNGHFPKLYERAMVPVFACLSLCFLFIWLHGLVVKNQSRWNVQ